MKPVVKRMVQLHQLDDGTYDIDQLADLNEALDEIDEYERRAEAVAKEGK